MWWKIKRWWLFQLSPPTKVGTLMTFYPFKANDTLRQDLIVKGIKGEYVLFSYVGDEEITKMHYSEFFECYINKKFIESWGVKL